MTADNIEHVMLASLAWGVLFLTDTLQVWHAVVILLVHGAAGVVGASAAQLILHDMVGAGQLPSAIRLNASSRPLSILLGPAVGGGLMLLRVPYTGHAEHAGPPPRARHFGLGDTGRLFREVRADRRLVTMMVLGGATSFFVGNAFQAQMPEYAHDLGADEAGVWYSVLLAANAAGAVFGAVLLETVDVLRPSARVAIVCAAVWGVTMGLFPAAASYGAAVTLLELAGVFNLAFTSMAQTLVQVLAPTRLRGRGRGDRHRPARLRGAKRRLSHFMWRVKNSITRSIDASCIASTA